MKKYRFAIVLAIPLILAAAFFAAAELARRNDDGPGQIAMGNASRTPLHGTPTLAVVTRSVSGNTPQAGASTAVAELPATNTATPAAPTSTLAAAETPPDPAAAPDMFPAQYVVALALALVSLIGVAAIILLLRRRRR